MRANIERNPHCFLFGVGWPSVAMGTGRRLYVYLGPWLVTVTWNSGVPALMHRGRGARQGRGAS